MIPKFRAWDPHEKKMVDDTELVIWGGNIYQGNRQRIFERIVEGKKGLIGYSIGDKYLMQSTGLFDKNGKEIFEGDIIDTTDYEGGLSSVGNPLVKVERDKYGFVVIGDFPASPITLKEFEAGRKFAGVEIIIAGNIYENPELVEVIDD